MAEALETIEIETGPAPSASMILLHGFIKKTQKTPASEITLAERRYKEWKHDENS